MKPLICPQCGGKITNYSIRDNFAVCGYCTTEFVVEPEKPAPLLNHTAFDDTGIQSTNPNLFIGVLIAVGLIFCLIITLAILPGKNKTTSSSVYAPVGTYPTRTPSPTPTPKLNLLEFGGKGTGEGMFKNADTLAVDAKGKIYVGDETLRVQQFDPRGLFLKLWQIPSQNAYYKRARHIQKIAVDEKDRLYVLVGGAILIYEADGTEPVSAFQSSPDYIVDFTIRNDGILLVVAANDNFETLLFVNRTGKRVRSIRGFHSEAADAAMSPPETGLAAIRIATDGIGNIFSVYALGDLGGYELNYNKDDFMIFRFSPEGKYVNKFAFSMDSCGIATDNQGRIYLSDKNLIDVYSNSGELISVVPAFEQSIETFALDKQNFVYVVTDDKVVKRPAI